jgi:hypothetical protein
LATLCERVAPQMRRAWAGADGHGLEAVDLSDRTPESVFCGGLPPWQAHGHLAEVARLVSAARRAPMGEEVEVAPAVRAALHALRVAVAPPGGPVGAAGHGRGRSVSARLAAVLASVARSAEPVVAVRMAGHRPGRSAGDRWSSPVPARLAGEPADGGEGGGGEVYAEPDRAGPA